MLWLYRSFALLASPWMVRRLHRDASDGTERERLIERRGQVEPAGESPIWIHAASVGEVNAVRALVEALLARPEHPEILISTFTLSGARQVRSLFGDRVAHRLAPIDRPGPTKRWLEALRPRLGLVVETELWPELFHQAERAGIDLILINARLSERGFRRSMRLRPLFRQALDAVRLALCQSERDAERLTLLGLEESRCRVTGNLKFDASLPQDLGSRVRELQAQWGARRAWTAGSTRPGEEAILLEAHRQAREACPDGLLVLAPRHPERAAEVAELIDAAGLKQQRLGETIERDTAVVLVDRIGVLQACYAASAVAFVGGSLVELGGHNLLEPAACGKPVLAGPHLDNQRAMAEALQGSGAFTPMQTAEALASAVIGFWQHPETALEQGRAALSVVEQGRGSLRATLRQLEPWLER
ncbi:3-deoxy-D-manno-octulosonic acid transferase [Wenzhouxiangella marina]|uniref:3-deoxy-D-manno-octulosonic acid transferase n=1 Tax=Wenzhouxiangella marina TaxID=1579979 RepID=A0A0K0XTS8_9GAMM|nr:3-deoxy-D-manno-octulosonic acid transferase [Wenzhouxiangella marina]AKS41027.1 3-deoxy-D-manno-octulosonic-acid transferase [Wenzhouxiangella marina]MBB6087905.1 3-deoxy-D-manno-octulosonic-acid transferase [Wenzhouxiangella marina]